MNEIRLELKIKNAVLWRAIHETDKGISAFCRRNGWPQRSSLVCAYITRSGSPYGRSGLKKPALWLCDVTGLAADVLFPPSLYVPSSDSALPRTLTVETDAERFLPLSSVRGLLQAPTQEIEMQQSDLRAEVGRVLGLLTAREQKVIKLRFGLGEEDGHEHTLREVAEQFGVGPERIRQIEAKAMRKLRHPLRARGFKPFLEGSEI